MTISLLISFPQPISFLFLSPISTLPSNSRNVPPCLSFRPILLFPSLPFLFPLLFYFLVTFPLPYSNLTFLSPAANKSSSMCISLVILESESQADSFPPNSYGTPWPGTSNCGHANVFRARKQKFTAPTHTPTLFPFQFLLAAFHALTLTVPFLPLKVSLTSSFSWTEPPIGLRLFLFHPPQQPLVLRPFEPTRFHVLASHPTRSHV